MPPRDPVREGLALGGLSQVADMNVGGGNVGAGLFEHGSPSAADEYRVAGSRKPPGEREPDARAAAGDEHGVT
jgi:hypothetical protein